MLKFQVFLSQIHVSAREDPEMTQTIGLLMHELGKEVSAKQVLEERSEERRGRALGVCRHTH